MARPAPEYGKYGKDVLKGVDFEKDIVRGYGQCISKFSFWYRAVRCFGNPQYADKLDEVPGIFALMIPMPGAIEAFHELADLFDTYILSTAPWENPSAWSDKLLWAKKYIGKNA